VTSYKILNADKEDVTNCYKAAKLVDGTLTVTKRQVTLTSDTGSKQYDGTPLTNSKVIVSGDEFVDGEGASYDVTGSQTIPGTSANTFTYELNENTKADNYNITTVTGSLVVTQRDAITITANSKSKMYDGEALTLTNSDYTITSGSLADCDELSVTIEGTITDAGTVVSKVTSYKIIDKKTGEEHTGYYAKVNLVEGTLTVTKRDVTLTSNDATKKYDGTALTDDGVTASGSGFIQGQGFTYEVSGSQTAVGSSANTFTYKLTDGTKASNYNITTEYGTLKVTPNDTLITITAGSATKEYDGTALTYTEGFTVDGKLAEGDEVVSVSTAASAVVHVSDGTGINEITGCVIKNKAGEDVTDFYINVQTQTGTLKINPRKVYMTSADAIKVYDETALTADDMIFSNWLPGDTATYSKITGSQTTIGQSDNTWDMDSVKLILGSGAEEGDYDITTGMGLLTVIPGDPLKVDKNSVAGTALQLPCDMTVESTTITDAKALKLKDEATLTTDELTLAGGALDATDGTAKIGAIVAESGNNIVTGDVEALTEDGAITIDVARYARLTIDWDLFDQAFYGWQSITAKKDCWLYVTAEEEITLVQDDLMAFDKSGRFAHLVFADQDVVDVNNLKLTSGDYLDIHFQNGYGTEKADTITAAAGAYVRLTASGEGGLDLAEGKNKVMIGSSATLGLFGKLMNATTINVAAGKEDDLTDAMFDVVEGTQTLKAGNFTEVSVSGLFTGTERADSIVIGNNAKFETSKTMNLGDGNDKLTVGKNSEFTANGINCGEGKDTLTVGKDSTLSLLGVVDFGNGNDKLEIGAGAKADAYDTLSFGSGNDTLTLGAEAELYADKALTFGAGNDKLSIGAEATIRAGDKLDFGEGNDTLTLGKNATFDGAWEGSNCKIDFGNGSDKLTLGAGATLKAKSIFFDFCSMGSDKDALTVGAGAEISVTDYIAGSLNKLTVASGTKKDGTTKLTVTTGADLSGTGKADAFSFGNDVVADFGSTNVNLSAGNDTFKVGNESQVSLGDLDFGVGKDTLTIGKNSTVSVNKLDNLEKLTIGTGSTLVIANLDSYNAAIAKWGEKYSGQIVCP